MDLARGFVVEYRPCGLQKSSGARVMGEKFGPENGMDRRSVHGPVSIGPESLARISFGHDSHPDGCPRGRQQAQLLESGWHVFGVECDVQLAVCAIERQVSSLHGISLDATLARVYCSTPIASRISYEKSSTTLKTHTHVEPRHIQYVPVRNEVVEIVETQMAETNGDLVQFGEGRPLLTLHFKREVVV